MVLELDSSVSAPSASPGQVHRCRLLRAAVGYIALCCMFIIMLMLAEIPFLALLILGGKDSFHAISRFMFVSFLTLFGYFVSSV